MQGAKEFSDRELQDVTDYNEMESIRFAAKALYRTGVLKTGLMEFLALNSGTTPLNFAVIRGDVEIVKILLENGADPYVENDLGMNAFEICKKADPFRVLRCLQYYLKRKRNTSQL